MTQLQFSEAIPLSLYIHLPWCIRKCPYCDFNSHEKRSEKLPEAQYIDALLKDLEASIPLVWGRRVSTIFIGGGTPSLFSAEGIDQLISQVRGLLNVKPDAEITMEANPGTFEAEKFADFRSAGINRLSIGIQSLDNDQLERLGRVHDRHEALNAFKIARDAGFDNINLDMMFALPDQTLSQATEDLEALIALQAEHISYYQLTLEPNTLFFKYPPPIPAHDLQAEMSDSGRTLLEESGYGQYEVSAFALRERRCRHNVNYWEFGDYLGIGAGAHGKITDQGSGKILRTVKPRQPKQYMDGMADQILPDPSIVSRKELPFEFFLNALRLNEGVSTKVFSERTGLPETGVTDTLTTLRDDGLLEPDQDRIQTTVQGRRFIDDIAQKFLV